MLSLLTTANIHLLLSDLLILLFIHSFHVQLFIRLDVLVGLSVVQKCNPDATLLAHENTARRIRKGVILVVVYVH